MCEGEKAELRCYGQWANPVDGAYPDEHTEVRLCVELLKLCRVKIVREAVVRKTVQEGVGTTIIEDGVTATIRSAPAAIRKSLAPRRGYALQSLPFCGVGLPSCQAHLCCLPFTVSKGARPRASCSTVGQCPRTCGGASWLRAVAAHCQPLWLHLVERLATFDWRCSLRTKPCSLVPACWG